jgi:hypothetical protein
MRVMVWRKWFVRGVVFGIVGSCVLAASLYEQWTNPAAVREQVLAKLSEIFPGANISVDSARLRLLGGIQVQELRLVRKKDADNVDLTHIPSAVIYHDKEKLLEGEMSLRKVELFRPRIRVYRDKDGKWNFAGIIAPPRLDRFVPTLVVHEGSLILEDRSNSGNITSIEITDLNLVLVNDPIGTLKFDGVGQSPLLGRMTVAGTLQRATAELTLSMMVRETPLTTKLLDRLTPWCANQALQQLEIAGTADIDARLHVTPGESHPLKYDVQCRVRKTNVQHPILPMSLEELAVDVRLADGEVTVSKATAKSGTAALAASGSGKLPCIEQTFEGTLEARGVTITEELAGRLPAKLQALYQLYRPAGPANIVMTLARRDGEWVMTRDGQEPVVSLQLAKSSASFVKFPYTVNDIVGSVNHYLVSRRTHFDIEGKASGQPVTARGRAVGSGVDLDLEAEITPIGVPIDDMLLRALPPGVEQLARTFHASGKLDASIKVRHQPGATTFRNEFYLTLREGAVCWESFPLQLSQVSGRLDILPEGWKFHDFRGEHDGGTLWISGETFAVAGQSKPGVTLQIDGRNVPLGEPLHRALQPLPSLKKTWEQFQPRGRMDFRADIRRPTDALEDLDVTVAAKGATVMPVFFPFVFDEVAGVGHFAKGRLNFKGLSARHGDMRCVLSDGATVDLRAGGGYHADLRNVDIDNLVLDPDLLKALPEALRRGCESLRCSSPIRSKARIVIDQPSEPGTRPDIYWNAEAWIKNAEMFVGVPVDSVTGVIGCIGRHNGHKLLGLEGNILLASARLFSQPMKDVSVHFEITEEAPDVLMMQLNAPLYGGAITGEVRIDFNSTLRYELNLTLSIDLEKFSHKNFGDKTKLEGKAVGRLRLVGTSAGIATLDGHGSLEVINGKLYNLPLLLDLLKFLGLRWPDRTAFEELHADFRVQGRRVTMRRLQLQGNAISVTGQGDFNFDGTELNLDFYPTWARIDQLLPPALRAFPPALSKNFLVIEMRGKVTSDPNDLKFNKRPVPVLMDPLNGLRNRMLGSPTTPATPAAPTEATLPRAPALGPVGEQK